MLFISPAFAATESDETLDPRAAAFFASRGNSNDDSNASIGLAGLNAPAGHDFMAYGRMQIRSFGSASGATNKDQNDDKRLEVVWNRERMECWTDDYAPFEQSPECALLEEAIKTLEDNAELLARYRKIQGLPVEPGIWLFRGSQFIAMAKLTAIAIKVDWRQGRFEDAYRKWADQQAFMRKMTAGGGTWVGTAISLVNEGINLTAGETLLFHAPQLIETHHDELRQLLKPSGISHYNLAEIVRSEYAVTKFLYDAAENKKSLFPNYITNRFFRYGEAVLKVAHSPTGRHHDQRADKCECVKDLEITAANRRFADSAKFVRDGIEKIPISIIQSMYAKDRLMLLLTLKIDVIKNKVADAGIAAFSAAFASDKSTLLAGALIRWDPDKRALSFENPKRYGGTEVRL